MVGRDEDLDKFFEDEFERAHDFEQIKGICCVSLCGRDEIDQDVYKSPYCWEHLIATKEYDERKKVRCSSDGGIEGHCACKVPCFKEGNE